MWRFLKRILTKDIRLKVASLLMAAVFMVLVLANLIERRDFAEIPVRIERVQPNMWLEEGWQPSNVDIEVAGFRDQLDEMRHKVDVVVCAAKITTPGTKTIPLTPSDLRIHIPPEDSRLVRIVKDSVEKWRIQACFGRYTAMVRVARPIISGTPDPSFFPEPVEVSVDPPEIEVTGPPRRLDELENGLLVLKTSSVDVTGVDQAVLAETHHVDFELAGVMPVDSDMDTVSVNIRFERTNQRTGFTIRRARGPRRTRLVIDPPEVNIVLEGPGSILDRIEEGALEIWVRGDPEGNVVLDASSEYSILPLPMGVRMVGRFPPSVRVKEVKKAPGSDQDSE